MQKKKLKKLLGRMVALSLVGAMVFSENSIASLAGELSIEGNNLVVTTDGTNEDNSNEDSFNEEEVIIGEASEDDNSCLAEEDMADNSIDEDESYNESETFTEEENTDVFANQENEEAYLTIDESLSENSISENLIVYENIDTANSEYLYSGHIDNDTVQGIDWYITKDNELVISGTGEYLLENFDSSIDEYRGSGFYKDYIPWIQYNDLIYSAKIKLSETKNLSGLLCGCYKLKSVDLSELDTSKTIIMRDMFMNCGLTKLDLSNFDTSQVKDMSWMFYGCASLTELDLSIFDTSKVTDMSWMFLNCSSLTELDLLNFDTSNVTNMKCMFDCCGKLTELDLSNFDTSKVTNMSDMFNWCRSLTNIDISNFDTSQVTSMDGMFYDCISLRELDVSNFNTSNVTNMSGMFELCVEDGIKSSLTELDISNFDTSNVTQMGCMFHGCSALTELDVSSFDTSNVNNMYSMFEDCSSLTELDLSTFDTSKVKYMLSMFSGCSSLTILDLSNFETEQVTYTQGMFSNCKNLETIIIKEINLKSIENYSHARGMFSGCTNLKLIPLPKNISVYYGEIDLPPGTWYRSDNNQKVNTIPKNITTDIVLYNSNAKFNIIFDPENGQDSIQKLNILYGKAVPMPTTPKRTGYNFMGWYTEPEGNGTKISSTTKVTGDATYYAYWKEYGYSIVFNKNSGVIQDYEALANMSLTFTETGILPGTAVSDEDLLLYYDANNADLIIRDGYILYGWNTKANGTGKHYDCGASVSGLSATNNGKVTLYAEWKPVTYQVFYVMNEDAQCTVTNPNQDRHAYVSAFSLKNPTMNGYTFAGWYYDYDSETGKGIGAKVTSIPKNLDGEVTLYATWIENKYNVAFNVNGGSYSSDRNKKAATQAALAKMTGNMATDDITLPNISDGIDLTRKGYILTGWNTAKNGTGTHYDMGESVSRLVSKNNGTVTLYAEWTPIDYTVTYVFNAPEGEVVNSPLNRDTHNVTAALSLKNPTRTGYTFVGWYYGYDETTGKGIGTKVTSIAKTKYEDVILYAVWMENTYTINYDSNRYVVNGQSVTGSAATAITGRQLAQAGNKYTAVVSLSEGSWTRNGYELVGWSTNKNGTRDNGIGTFYELGEEVSGLSSAKGGKVTLYAVWE